MIDGQSFDRQRTRALAARIGQNLFPRRRLYRSSLQVEAFTDPSLDLGGDLFDIIPMDKENLLALLVGDVSGKGVPAAIFMSMLKGMLWTLTRYYASPSEILQRANALLLESSRARKFATLFLVVIDLAGGEMRYSCAGHNPAILLGGDGRIEHLRTRGLPLGVSADAWYEEKVFWLARNDLLALYTDGITEASSPAGEEFGEERLIGFLRAAGAASLHEIVSGLQEELDGFRSHAPPEDDVALILTRYLLPAVGPQRRERSYASSMHVVPGLLDFVEDAARRAGLQPSRLNDLLISAEEIATNIIRHGQPTPGRFTVTALTEQHRFVVEMCDRGAAFDPTVHRCEERQGCDGGHGGGKGLLLVRELVDHFSWRRDPARGNVVTLAVDFQEPGP